jgi:triacylglycerol lipase
MNLVFASGFLFPQQLFGVDYFKGLKAHIGDRHETVFPLVPALGGCAQRAQVLADAIQQKYPTGPIHIIAHSMAGLDSRFLIGNNLNGLATPGRIASLTTLATPHLGSPVADLLVGPEPTDERRILYKMIKSAFEAAGIDTGALADLTTAGAAQVPNAAQSHPHIRYRSYAATGRSGPRPPTCIALALTHQYVQLAARQKGAREENDGVVALDSARYGEFQMPSWSCDHVDMVGHNLDPVPLGFHFDHFAAIDGIIDRL